MTARNQKEAKMTDRANDGNLRSIKMMETEMKRDDDLIRKLMLELEADPEPVVHKFMGAGASPEAEREYYHLLLLADAGYLEVSGRYRDAFRITNAGHDFLAVLASDGIWAKARAKALEVTPRYGLKLLAEIGNELIRQTLRDQGLLP